MVSLPACLSCNIICYGVVSGWFCYVMSPLSLVKKMFASGAYASLVSIYFEMDNIFFINPVFTFLVVRL
jgi:hypothetical protein